jgi:hypothetical protein
MDRVSQRSDSRAREFSVPRPLAAAAPLLVAAMGSLALAASTVVPPAAALAVAAACFILAAFRAAVATRDRWLLRRQADGLLRTGIKVHPQSALLVWRAAELTSLRNRRIFSSSLKSLTRELLRPSVVSAVPLNRRAVRPHHALLQQLASRLDQVDRPVAPRGMVLVEELLTDGLTSPLYVAGCNSDVPAVALERCLSALDGDADTDQGVVVQFAAQGRGGVPARSDHRNHAHSGGSR